MAKTISISMSEKVLNTAKAKTEKLGIHFSEYIRQLIIRDVYQELENTEVKTRT